MEILGVTNVELRTINLKWCANDRQIGRTNKRRAEKPLQIRGDCSWSRKTNWSCAHPFYERFCGRISVRGLTKSKSCENRSRTTKRVARSVHGRKTRWPPTMVFTGKPQSNC
nr:uncharacterized protein LOC118683269 [Bactrocera oleae]